MLLRLLVLINILVVTGVYQARLAAVLSAAAFPLHLHLMVMLQHVLLLVALSLLLVLVRIHILKVLILDVSGKSTNRIKIGCSLNYFLISIQ